MIRNQEISEMQADAAQARAEAAILTRRADKRAFEADCMAAHAEGLHSEIPREGCPDCEA